MFKVSFSIPAKVHLACVALAGLIFQPVQAKVSTSKELPIIVIGAGTAGLSAAQKLQQSHKNVLVLEAKDRIGGRIHSDTQDHVTMDLGASWIHGIDGNPIWDIAQKNKIKTTIFDEDVEAFTFFHPQGKPFTEQENIQFSQYVEQVEEKLAQTKTQHSAQLEITQILNELECSDQIKQKLFEFFEYLAKDPFATSLDRLSSQYPKYEGYFAGHEMIFPEGYSQIINTLATSLPIQTNTTIQSIELKKGYVKLTDQNHKHYYASKVIVTVPLGILKKNKINFKPDLPTPYLHAIQDIGFGSFNKVFLEFKQPIQLEHLRQNPTIGGYYQYNGQWWNIIDLTTVYHKPIYLMLFGGKDGNWVDQSSDDTIWHTIHASLKANFKNTPDQPQKMVVTRWGNDPQSYGSFSFPDLNYSPQLIQTLNTPIHHQLYFAGEHCSVEYAGTVHGAYISGQQTADRILNQP